EEISSYAVVFDAGSTYLWVTVNY
nr:nucleotide triphosphatase - garden pea (fragments) [Pisum sativum]